MRAPRLQAAMAAFTEMVSGLLLVVGLFVPTASAAVCATMIVAIVVAHRSNGFFIFNEGQGWEYCALIAFVSVSIAGLGGGRISVDNALGIDYDGTWGFATAAILGAGSAIAQLGISYRPKGR